MSEAELNGVPHVHPNTLSIGPDVRMPRECVSKEVYTVPMFGCDPGEVIVDMYACPLHVVLCEVPCEGPNWSGDPAVKVCGRVAFVLCPLRRRNCCPHRDLHRSEQRLLLTPRGRVLVPPVVDPSSLLVVTFLIGPLPRAVPCRLYRAVWDLRCADGCGRVR